MSAAESPASRRAAVGAGQSELFDDLWAEMTAGLYDERRARAWLTEENRRALRAEAREAPDVLTLARGVVNPFIAKLGVSHTHLFTDDEFGFYVLRSMFTHHDIFRPVLTHIGVQLTDGQVVREVLDGYPAQQAGLRRGDRLLEIDGRPYLSIKQFEPHRQQLTVARGQTRIDVDVTPVTGSANEALLRAMQNSVTISEHDGLRIGHVHLWSGTSTHALARFERIVRDDLAGVDAMVLDLRGGYGGAWWSYLDPFFSDRSDFFSFTVIDRTGLESEPNTAPARSNPKAYAGPLVVLINEGTRSGKEAIAYQFKRSRRAVLVGTTTAGAFTAGKGVFADRLDATYMLFMAVSEFRLDGQTIEGRGVAPDVEVPYPLDGTLREDPQRRAAFALAVKLAKRRAGAK